MDEYSSTSKCGDCPWQPLANDQLTLSELLPVAAKLYDLNMLRLVAICAPSCVVSVCHLLSRWLAG